MVWTDSLTAQASGSSIPDIAAFRQTLQRLMDGHTVGSAAEPFGNRFSFLSGRYFVGMNQTMFGGKQSDNELLLMKKQAIDARNHIIVGDPAVYLPIA